MHTTQPLPTAFNLADYVLQAGRATPDKPALEIVGTDEVWSHGVLRSTVARLAAGLQTFGLKPGDKILFRIGNTFDFPLAYLASIWAGCVPVPVSSLLTQREITTVAEDIQPKLVLYADGISRPQTPAALMPLDDFHALIQATPVDPHMTSPHDLAYILYTSGTTSTPRRVRHAHRAILARKMMHEDWYGLTAADRILHAGAFNWSYTLGTGLLDPWSVGATAVILGQDADARDLMAALGSHGITIFAAVPGIYRKLLRLPQTPSLPDLRHGLSAGESLPPSIREAWRMRFGSDIHEALGMTECSTFISGAPHRAAPPGTLGYPQNGRSIAVLDDSGVPAQTGHLAISIGDLGLMLGYGDDTLPEGDWFVTEDLVEQLPDGALRHLGRADDVITAGGFRIAPTDIEEAFTNFTGIITCAATAVQHGPETTLIALFYTAPEPLADADLRAHAQTLLAPYKRPHLYIHRPTLPMNANGKLNRRHLREEYHG